MHVVCPRCAVCLLHPYLFLCQFISKAVSSLVRCGGTEGLLVSLVGIFVQAAYFLLEFLIQLPRFLHFLLFPSLLVSGVEVFPAQRGWLLPAEHHSLRSGPLAARIARLLQGFALRSVKCVVAPNGAFVLRFRFMQVLSLLEAKVFYLFI